MIGIQVLPPFPDPVMVKGWRWGSPPFLTANACDHVSQAFFSQCACSAGRGRAEAASDRGAVCVCRRLPLTWAPTQVRPYIGIPRAGGCVGAVLEFTLSWSKGACSIGNGQFRCTADFDPKPHLTGYKNCI